MQSNNAVCTRTNKAYHCSKCKQSFDMKRCFLKHLQLHFRSKDFECAECGERFYQRHCLELHRVTHLDVRKNRTVPSSKQLLFECKLCRTRFSSVCRLKNHIKLLHRHANATANTRQKPPSVQAATMRPEAAYHICYHCQSTFGDKRSFSEHIREHSLNFECVACPESFDSKEELKTHSWTHFSFYSCSACHSVFKSPGELARHGPCRTSSAEETRLSCDVCGAVFAKQQLLQRHLQRRHAKQFRCGHCGAGHHSQSALRAHEQSHGLDRRVYRCSDCPASSRSLAELRAHQLTHAADAGRCSLCKEAFASEQQRRQHKHLFLGNVKCDLCQIQCSGSHGLNMHRRLAHPGARACSPRAPAGGEHVVVCVGDVVE
ncbi:zinc finger protein 84-like isoform X2 [Bacillus rossius redtenbacheri]